MSDKFTHYKLYSKAKYMAAEDVPGVVNLTINHAKHEKDQSGKTKEMLEYPVIYFKEDKFSNGLKIKPHVSNATKSRLLSSMTGSVSLESWAGLRVTIYRVEGVRRRDGTTGPAVKFAEEQWSLEKPQLTPDNKQKWQQAINALNRDGNLRAVLERVEISKEHQDLIMQQASEGDDNANQ